MQVVGWVVGWGATWGAANESKVAKIRSQLRWLKKIRKIKNVYLVVRNTSNLMINTKKF